MVQKGVWTICAHHAGCFHLVQRLNFTQVLGNAFKFCDPSIYFVVLMKRERLSRKKLTQSDIESNSIYRVAFAIQSDHTAGIGPFRKLLGNLFVAALINVSVNSAWDAAVDVQNVSAIICDGFAVFDPKFAFHN
jgi:hypothetical protein